MKSIIFNLETLSGGTNRVAMCCGWHITRIILHYRSHIN